jgi:hypothetical protein
VSLTNLTIINQMARWAFLYSSNSRRFSNFFARAKYTHAFQLQTHTFAVRCYKSSLLFYRDMACIWNNSTTASSSSSFFDDYNLSSFFFTLFVMCALSGGNLIYFCPDFKFYFHPVEVAEVFFVWWLVIILQKISKSP